MPNWSDSNGPRCKGKSRQSGLPCALPPTPFGEFCRFHGGNLPAQREKARKRMLDYAQWSTDPHYIKNIRIRQWQQANDRWEMRQAKKRGPQAVAQLLAHRAAEKAEKEAWYEENRRARDQARVDYNANRKLPKRKRPTGPAMPPPSEQPRFIPYGDGGF